MVVPMGSLGSEEPVAPPITVQKNIEQISMMISDQILFCFLSEYITKI